jgi:hypothetical protein
MGFFGFKLLLEQLFAPIASTFEFGHFGRKIVDQGSLYRNRVSNYRASNRDWVRPAP